MRYRLYRVTPEHRGLRRYIWTWREGLQWGCLLALALLMVWVALPWVIQLWFQLLGHAWPKLGLGAADQVDLVVRNWGLFELQQVKLVLHSPLPSFVQWWGLWGLSIGMLVASFLISRESLPLIYLLRIVVFLMVCSLLANEFLTSRINSDAGDVLSDLMGMATYLFCFLPVIHALVLYIFPLAWPLKVLSTVVALGFVVISVPLQVGTLGLVALHGSSVMLLPIYMLGTFLPQLVIQLGVYGYFMSLARSPKLV